MQTIINLLYYHQMQTVKILQVHEFGFSSFVNEYKGIGLIILYEILTIYCIFNYYIFPVI